MFFPRTSFENKHYSRGRQKTLSDDQRKHAFFLQTQGSCIQPSKRVQQRIGNRDVGQTLREGGLAYSQKREKDTQRSEFTNLGFGVRWPIRQKVFGSENSGR